MTKTNISILFFITLSVLTGFTLSLVNLNISWLTLGLILFVTLAMTSFYLAQWIQARQAPLSYSLKKIKSQLDLQLMEKSEETIIQDAIFSHMQEGILVTNSLLKIKYINHSAKRILGTSGETFLNQSAQGLIRNSDILNFIKKAVEKNETWESELDLLDSPVKSLHIHAQPLELPQAVQKAFIFVLSDISQVKTLENTRRDFVANVSHELRTPLTSIQGFTETLIQHPALEVDKRKQFLDIIHSHTVRLGRLVEDLLTLSRVERQAETGAITLNPTPLKPVIQAALKMCEPHAKGQGIKLNLECSEGLSAKINAPLLEQALVNLLDNAIKYSEPNKYIKVSAAEYAGEIKLSVADQGIGIPPEYLERIFERFYRIDKARSKKVGGTGLGLSIVKHIAVAHGAQVHVQSDLNKGSTFSISLPAI